MPVNAPLNNGLSAPRGANRRLQQGSAGLQPPEPPQPRLGMPNVAAPMAPAAPMVRSTRPQQPMGLQASRDSLIGRNNAVYNSMGRQSPYMQGLHAMAGDIAAGGAAPTYRAGQQILSASQANMLRAPMPQRGIQMGEPQLSASFPQMTQNDRGADVFGLPGFQQPHSTIYDGATMPGGSVVSRTPSGGLALKGSLTPEQREGFETAVTNARAVRAEKLAMDADTRFLQNAKRLGLSMNTPRAQMALGRLGKIQQQNQQQKQLAQLQMKHTMAQHEDALEHNRELDKEIRALQIAHATGKRWSDPSEMIQKLEALKKPLAFGNQPQLGMPMGQPMAHPIAAGLKPPAAKAPLGLVPPAQQDPQILEPGLNGIIKRGSHIPVTVGRWLNGI